MSDTIEGTVIEASELAVVVSENQTSLEVPSVTTTEAKIIASDIAAKAKNFAKWIKDQAKKLAKQQEAQ